MKKWKLPDGLYTASLTPLKNDLSIDHKKLITHCKFLLESGCTGIALMGTTGEANSFSADERQTALQTVLGAGIPAEKIIIGTGCSAFPDTLALTRHALSKGVGGVLMLPPFYYKNVSDDGIFYAFENIINQTNDPDLQIYLYHFPQMSMVPFSLDVIGRLLNSFPEHIAGIKDSGGNWDNIFGMHEKFPGFKIYAGTERFLTAVKEIKAAGCISATTNLSSKTASILYHEKDNQKFESLQNKLNALRETITKHPIVPALKMVMAKTSGDEGWLNMRPPHVPLKKNSAAVLFEDLASIGFPEKYT